MSKECPEIEDLAAFAEGKLTPKDRIRLQPRIEAHLLVCNRCREIVVFAVKSKEEVADPIPDKSARIQACPYKKEAQ